MRRSCQRRAQAVRLLDGLAHKKLTSRPCLYFASARVMPCCMMTLHSPRVALGLVLCLATLGACRTTAEADWMGNPSLKPFRQAAETCEVQVNAIRIGAERDRFYVECMAALGWRPRLAEEPVLPRR